MNYRLSYITPSLSLIIIVIILITYNITNDIFVTFPTHSETQCQTFGCQKTFSSILNTAILKSFIAFFNIFIAILLGFLVRTRVSASLTIKRINQVVLRMAIGTIILDFFPNLAATIGMVSLTPSS